MPIAFDFASSLSGIAVSSLTFSHTCAGANRYMFVGAGNYQTSGQVVNTVTFNGVALTEIHEFVAGQVNSAIWEKIAPAAVTANVVVTWSASAEEIAAGAVSFTGVGQTTPRRGTYALANGTGLTATVDIASAVNDWVIDFVNQFWPTTIAVGANQTLRWSREKVGGYSSYGSSTEAGAATVTMSWTFTRSDAWSIYAVSLIPAGYTEDIVSLATSISSVADVQSFAEALTSAINSLSSLSEAQAFLETVQTQIASQSAVSEAQTYSEDIQAQIISQSTVAALQTFLEDVQTVASSAASLEDIQAYIETVSTLITSQTTIDDVIGFFETLDSVITSVSSINDVQTFVEMIQANAQSSASIAEQQAFIEDIASTITSISSVDDKQLFIDNIDIMIQSHASLDEIMNYIEQVQTTAVSGAEVSDVLIVGYMLGQIVSARIFELAAGARVFDDEVGARDFEAVVAAR